MINIFFQDFRYQYLSNITKTVNNTCPTVHSFWWKPFRLVKAIVFIDFMVFKDQLIAVSEYLYTSCVDQVY